MVRDESIPTKNTFNATCHCTPHGAVVVFFSLSSAFLIHWGSVTAKYPYYVPLIFISRSKSAGISFSIDFVKDNRTLSPQVSNLVAPSWQQTDVHVLLRCLLNRKVDMIPIIILISVIRIVARCDQQLRRVFVIQWPVTIAIGFAYAIFFRKGNRLEYVETLLMPCGNK